jgi:hypothetical protein
MKTKGIYIAIALAGLGFLYWQYVQERKRLKTLNDLAKKEIETLLLEFNRQGAKFPTLAPKITLNLLRNISPDQTLIREAIYIAMDERKGMVNGTKVPRYIWLNILNQSMKQ